MIKICSLILVLIILLILTGHLKRDSGIIQQKKNGKDMKEHYGEPPGMLPAMAVSEYTDHPALIVSPSKEWLEWNCGPSLKCKDTPEGYFGWPTSPLEFHGTTASSVSQFIERTA